jgi:polyisoprenoid-binding protein YceI
MSPVRRLSDSLAGPLLAAALFAAPPPFRAAEPSVKEWTIDTSRSKLIIHVAPGGLLSPTLHPHNFQPDEWSGEISWDPKNPRTVKVEVKVTVASLHDKQEKQSAKDTA